MSFHLLSLFVFKKARNFLHILRIKEIGGGQVQYDTNREFEVPAGLIFDGSNFRWGGNMFVIKNGELEVYSIARLFDEGAMGSLNVLLHKWN